MVLMEKEFYVPIKAGLLQNNWVCIYIYKKKTEACVHVLWFREMCTRVNQDVQIKFTDSDWTHVLERNTQSVIAKFYSRMVDFGSK